MKKTDHVYDGIEELDNQLPRWWLTLFYLTIFFGTGYWIYYEFAGGPTLTQEYETEMTRMAVARYQAEQAQPKKASYTDEELIAAAKSSERRKAGEKAFQAKCSSCHGAQGQGSIGPNLTDAYWLHGGKPSQIIKTISNGVLDKGMPAWGPLVSPDELVALVTYVRSLQGTNPANPKAPQGEKQ